VRAVSRRTRDSVLDGHKPKRHEHGVLTRAADWSVWTWAAVPADAAERYAEEIQRLTGMAKGETAVVVARVEFGQVVRSEHFRVASATADG
jgi:hypothetical protein